MSYFNTVMSLRPAQYYTLSGPTGSVDMAGLGAGNATAMTNLSAPGLVAGSPVSTPASITGPNTFNLFSTSGKTNAFTVNFWVNPGAGWGGDAGNQVTESLFSVSGGSGIFYLNDRFVLRLVNGTTVYQAEAFAPELDLGYNVSAVFLDTAIYVVVNGVPGEPVLVPDTFVFPNNETFWTAGFSTAAVMQHLAIFTHALSIQNIRQLVSVGLDSHKIIESAVADRGEIFTMDGLNRPVVVDDQITVDEFKFADQGNLVVNGRGRMTLNNLPTIASVGPSGATGSVWSATGGYAFVGSTAAFTNNFITISDVGPVLTSLGALGGTFDFNSGVTATAITISTPSAGKNWVVAIGSNGVPSVRENYTNPDGTTGATVYGLTTAITMTRSANIAIILTESGMSLHTAWNGDNTSINQYAGSDFVPVRVQVDQTTVIYIGNDTTGLATPPAFARGVFLYALVPDNYSTMFDSIATHSPNVFYPLTTSIDPMRYSETTLTMPIPIVGDVAGSAIDYDGTDAALKFLDVSAANLVAYYDARYINGLTGAQPATGAAISQWNDISGNNRHVVQGTTSARPTYSPTGINGYPGVAFSAAAAQQLIFSSTDFLTGKNGFTAYAICLPNNMHGASTGYALGPYISNTSDAALILSLSTSPTPTSGQMWLRTGSTARAYTTSLGMIPAYTASVFSTSVNFSTKAITAAVNGMEFLDTASWATGTSDAVSNIAIGSTYNGRYLDGLIGAVAIFPFANNASQRRQYEAYLASLWGIPSHKGNSFYAKFATGTYENVRSMGAAPFGPTGAVGTSLVAGPLTVKKTMASYDTLWTPEFGGARLLVYGGTGVSGANTSDIASIKTFGPSAIIDSPNHLRGGRRQGMRFMTGGQIVVPADSVYTYELIVIPNFSASCEILCVNPGTHYSLTLNSATLTASGFSSVYVNGTLLSGSATLARGVGNHIVAISATPLASPAYLGGHSDGTLQGSKYTLSFYAQYDYALTATQIAAHHQAALGRNLFSTLESSSYTPAENASPELYSNTWDTTLSS